jgi:hypothetical protein
MPHRKVGLFLSKNQQSKNLFNSLLSIKNLDTVHCVIDQKNNKRTLEKNFFEKDAREKDQIDRNFKFKTKFNFEKLDTLLICANPESVRKNFASIDSVDKQMKIIDMSRAFTFASWYDYNLQNQQASESKQLTKVTLPYPIAGAGHFLFCPLAESLVKINSMKVVVGKEYFSTFYPHLETKNDAFDTRAAENIVLNELREVFYRLKSLSKRKHQFAYQIDHFTDCMYLDRCSGVFITAIVSSPLNSIEIHKLYKDFLSNLSIPGLKSTSSKDINYENFTISIQPINNEYMMLIHIKDCLKFYMKMVELHLA